tara:strand:- start:299 stop:958 length:660 start_codon:yes stop_codon:yes gene_type:complete
VKKFLILFTVFLFLKLSHLTYAIDLPKYYNFPKNYSPGEFLSSLKDFLLVSTEEMDDSRFKETVILLIDHDKEGALGLVINKPLGEISIGSLVQNQKDINVIKKKELFNIKIPIFWGGPLDNNKILILHSKDYKNQNTKIFEHLSISNDYDTLFAIAEKNGPKKSLVIIGISAWTIGQLEGEIIEKKYWVISEINEDIVFEVDNKKKFIKATKNSFLRL